jgi:hypothetical protein
MTVAHAEKRRPEPEVIEANHGQAVTTITERVGKLNELDGGLRSESPPFPRSAKVELTARCDLHCHFCASNYRHRVEGDMSQAVFRSTVSRLRRLGVDQLGLFYIGESFLCDWLPDAIRFAKDVCGYPYVFLTTNGLTATPQRLRACMKAGLDSLKFALNAASPSQFETITGSPAGYHRVIVANIVAARHIRDEVAASTGHHCALYASSLEYDNGQRTRMTRVLEEIRPFIDEHYWLPLLGHAPVGGEHGVSEPRAKRLPCPGLFKEAHITWDGSLAACSLDASRRFHIANLERETLTAAWHAPPFRTLRKAHLKGDVTGTLCEKCIGY